MLDRSQKSVEPAHTGERPAPVEAGRSMLLQKKIQRRALQRKEGAKTDPSAAEQTGTPLERFRSILGGPKLKDKEALAVWATVEDKSAAAEATVALAIEKLAPAAGHRVLKESGHDLSAVIVDAIVHKKGSWDQELRPQVEEIATCADSDPKARLRAVVKPESWRGLVKYNYKPKLSDTLAAGTTTALGKPTVVTVTDERWLKLHADLPGIAAPQLRWRIVLDEAVFGPAPAAPDGAPASAATVSYTLKPVKSGATQITVELTAFESNGYLGKDTHSYTINVIDAAADPESYFEARFQETFAEIIQATPFQEVKQKEHGIANLFSEGQRALLTSYMETKVVPPGLFTNEAANKSSGPQRVLLASNMLSYGKVKMGDKVLEGQKWCASCCGGWVNGVFAYAGTNAAKGYGSLSSEQSISPTGEKSYGAGTQDAVKGSNATSSEVSEVVAQEGALSGAVKSAKDRLAAAHKAGDSAAVTKASVDLAAAESEQAAKLPGLKDEEARRKLAVGASPTGTGHTPMSFDFLQSEMKSGDWLFLDNGGAAGHSVLFVDWADAEQSGSDAPSELGVSRPVRWRSARLYNQRQPKLGGTYDTYKLGYPYSAANHVNAVYAITHTREDSQVASTTEDFLAYDLDKAVAENDKILSAAKNNLDAAAVKAKLHGVVQGLVDGMKGKGRRADTVGRLSGDFSEPQQKIVAAILAGGTGDGADIANLVALGQKLSVIDVTSGDPTHPNGRLDQKINGGSSWSPPWPAWSGDKSLKKKAEAKAGGE